MATRSAKAKRALVDADARTPAETAGRVAAVRAAADARCAVEVAVRKRVEAAAVAQRKLEERVEVPENEVKVEREAAVSAQKAEVMPSRDRASALCFSLHVILLRRPL